MNTTLTTSSTPFTASFSNFDSRLSPAFERFPRTPREGLSSSPRETLSPPSSPGFDRSASVKPVEVEFDSNSAWPTIYSPQRPASNDDKVAFEFPRAWSPVDDLGLIASAWLVPAPSPECDPDAIAADCPVWTPGPAPYANKTDMKPEQEECETDSTVVSMSAFIELDRAPKTQMRSDVEAMSAIEEALKVKENPMGAVRDAEYREREMMMRRRRASEVNVNFNEEFEGDSEKPSSISRMSKVAHWLVRNDIEHTWRLQMCTDNE